MKPEPANYPEHCSGTRTISGFQGLIGDGSGNELYENNINCQTIIQPECARGEVSISFERFDLGEGDYINIHGGPSTDFPIIATLDQNNTPNGNYTSNNDGILLNFITDNTNQGTGWDVKYSSIVCSALTFNEPSGTITDGSGTCDYESGTTCFWYIEPTGASQIILNFTEFDLDVPTHDLLIIYENDFSTPVATYNSSQTPSSNIIINASKAIIRFVSYSSETNVGSGWSVDYTSNSTVSVNELINFDNLVKVYPNPFNENAFIEIGNSNNCNVSLTLTDIVGKTIASKSLGVIGTKQTVSLKDLDIKLTQKGIYLLNVEIDNQVKTYKLISE
jgi:hypothetical protein